MKISITLPSGEQLHFHNLSPLDFALALVRAWANGHLNFQTKESIEGAVRHYNSKKVVS